MFSKQINKYTSILISFLYILWWWCKRYIEIVSKESINPFLFFKIIYICKFESKKHEDNKFKERLHESLTKYIYSPVYLENSI